VRVDYQGKSFTFSRIPAAAPDQATA